MKVFSKTRGFTLIELLVVISIISLLSSIVLATLSDARSRGCDARRLAEIGQINTAIQLYIDDNGEAPPSNGSVTSDMPSWDTLAQALSPYIALPTDPCPGRTPFSETTEFNTFQAEGFAYAYRRMDDWWSACRSGDEECDPTGYVLDIVAFEKREKANNVYLYSYSSPYNQ